MAKGGKHNYIIVLPFNPFNSGNVRKINSFNQMNGAKGTIFIWDENFTFFSQNPQILFIHDFGDKKTTSKYTVRLPTTNWKPL